MAEDGTIEAVRVTGVSGFAFGIQWHPEWDTAAHPDRAAIFRAFGEACRRWRDGVKEAA